MIDRTLLIQTDGWVRASASLDVYAQDRCCHCYRKTGKVAHALHTARTNDGEWWVVPPNADLSGDEWRDFQTQLDGSRASTVLPIGPVCLQDHPEYSIGVES